MASRVRQINFSGSSRATRPHRDGCGGVSCQPQCFWLAGLRSLCTYQAEARGPAMSHRAWRNRRAQGFQRNQTLRRCLLIRGESRPFVPEYRSWPPVQSIALSETAYF